MVETKFNIDDTVYLRQFDNVFKGVITDIEYRTYHFNKETRPYAYTIILEHGQEWIQDAECINGKTSIYSSSMYKNKQLLINDFNDKISYNNDMNKHFAENLEKLEKWQ